MSVPTCPICNAAMVLRTARQGKNAGDQFYGCSNYPRCRQILPHDESKESSDASEMLENEVPQEFPHVLNARSKFQEYQVAFFETVAVPEMLLERVRDEVDSRVLQGFNQWRIDFPPAAQDSYLEERATQVISVCEKILTRGRLTLSSPQMEQKLFKLFNVNPDQILNGRTLSEDILQASFKTSQEHFWLDSEEERTVYFNILPQALGPQFYRWVTPQVEITSLLPLNVKEPVQGRVDFLVSHPRLQKPLVIEIGGAQHELQKQADNAKRTILRNFGYNVMEISAMSVNMQPDEIVSQLKELFIELGIESTSRTTSSQKLLLALKVAHQIQLSVLQGIKYGFIRNESSKAWKVFLSAPEEGMLDSTEMLTILTLAVEDLRTLLAKLFTLYSARFKVPKPVCKLGSPPKIGESVLHLSFVDSIAINCSTFYIQDICMPFHFANLSLPTNAAVIDEPDKKLLLYFLHYLFRKDEFWQGQYDSITRALQCKDAIVLLPTGGGKSIAFQLAGLLLPGRTVVIEPIISLIDDQIDNLANYGIDRCMGITSAITETLDRSRAINLFAQGEYLFVYIAPERFQTVEFRESLRALTTHTPVNVIVIDEAHCVSEWGHDFRTAYLNIGRISRIYCEAEGVIPPILALTGTASRSVLRDIQRELQIEDFDAIITPNSFDRSELQFNVIQSSSHEKFARLKGYLGHSLPSMFSVSQQSFYQERGKNTYSGLVFCPWVNGDFGVVRVAKRISDEAGIHSAFYAGGAPKSLAQNHWNRIKKSVAKKYKHNKVPLLACTSAFGMGIDKPNIRFTVHYGIPRSIESFYQEAGRAGRDRRLAHCSIIVSNDYPQRNSKLLDANTKVEEIATILGSTNYDDNDDITRALFFHTQAFRGIRTEMEEIQQVINMIDALSVATTQSISVKSMDRGRVEKGLHRLLILGIIADYTINYARNEFTIKTTGATREDVVEAYRHYVSGYLGARAQKEVLRASELLPLEFDDFIMKMVELLLHFVYESIEKGRRRALQEMLLAATDEPTNENVRQRILRYLEATEYAEILENMLQDDDTGMARVMNMFADVRSPNEAAELRGQASRYLESYPDYPGLLMLRSLAEIYTRDKNADIVKQDFAAAIQSALDNYSVDHRKLHEFIAWALRHIAVRDIDLADDMSKHILAQLPNENFAKALVLNLPDALISLPADFLLSQLSNRCRQILVTLEEAH